MMMMVMMVMMMMMLIHSECFYIVIANECQLFQAMRLPKSTSSSLKIGLCFHSSNCRQCSQKALMSLEENPPVIDR